MISNVYVGTSGWHYQHWTGVFYPEGMPSSEFFDYYKKFFTTVEINNTFYRMPKESTVHYWKDSAPEGFIFSVKASRYITHIKKLKGSGQGFKDFLEIVSGLGPHLGPILFQLPPKWNCDAERLKSFVSKLPAGYLYTFEFRNSEWFNDEVYQILTDHHCGFCIYDLNKQQSPKKVTSTFVYIRLHGPGEPYQGSYDKQSLQEWAREIKMWHAQGRQVYCYFDNDERGYAVKNAITLKEILDPG